jgi:general secretion pathway protein G
LNILEQHLPSQIKHRLKNRFKGFTLIELLVVLAIVATLLSLVAPRYFNQIETSKEVVLKDNLRSTREVIDKFYGDLGRYPESLDELVEKKYLRALPFDPMTESSDTWLIVNVPSGYKGNVYDLKSGAVGKSRLGQNYVQW